MERNQIWLIVAIALAIGITFEIIKGSSNHVRLAGLGRYQALLDDGRPLYIPSDDETKSGRSNRNDRDAIERRTLPKLAGLVKPLVAANSDAKSDVKPADAKTAAAKKDEPKKKDEKKTDEKKKKKKKKKKKDESKDSEEEIKDGEEQETSDNSDSKAQSAGGPEALAPSAGLLAAAPNNGIPRTYQEWERHLFYDPSFQKSNAFIKYYQTGLVSDEIFYAIVGAMLEDSRSNMREYGVMALGAAPGPRSFSMLVVIYKTEPSHTRLRNQARVYLNLYTRLEYLRHLAGAIRLDNDLHANYQALVLLRLAYERHLRSAKPEEPVPMEQESGRVPANSSNARYFNPFLNILKQVSVSAGDQGIRETANQALTDLQELLGANLS